MTFRNSSYFYLRIASNFYDFIPPLFMNRKICLFFLILEFFGDSIRKILLSENSGRKKVLNLAAMSKIYFYKFILANYSSIKWV